MDAKQAEKRFEEIIQEALDKAGRVPCPVVDYAEGLKSWLDPYGCVAMALDAAEQDL